MQVQAIVRSGRSHRLTIRMIRYRIFRGLVGGAGMGVLKRIGRVLFLLFRRWMSMNIVSMDTDMDVDKLSIVVLN